MTDNTSSSSTPMPLLATLDHYPILPHSYFILGLSKCLPQLGPLLKIDPCDPPPIPSLDMIDPNNLDTLKAFRLWIKPCLELRRDCKEFLFHNPNITPQLQSKGPSNIPANYEDALVLGGDGIVSFAIDRA